MISRLLFWSTCGLFVAILVGVAFFAYIPAPPKGIAIETKGQPTIGSALAKVHIVVFEEPKCTNCKTCNEEIFPAIKKKYIDTGKIRYTIIPVSFLPGSMPAAVALLCVYYMHPEYPNDPLFFTYFDYLYRHQGAENTDWVTANLLTDYAEQASPAIDPQRLLQCIHHETYRIQIEKNTEYGAALMGGRISTPMIYVNGVAVQELTLDDLSELIDSFLLKEGQLN